MGEVHIVGYHTCKRGTNPRYTKENAPFHSERNKNQWLTQGYYFWTDSPFFAKKWGNDHYREQDYAIARCLIKIDKELLLDLVGNVEHQEKFIMLYQRFKEYLERPEVQQRMPPDKRGKAPTVEAVIEMSRQKAQTNKRDFPYVAIKAQDWPGKLEMYSFGGAFGERMPALTRQQLCLFEEGKGCIQKTEFIHPPLFTL
jgi:hypothetical protein